MKRLTIILSILSNLSFAQSSGYVLSKPDGTILIGDGKITQAQVQNLVSDLALKQNALVSGVSIKTINGNNLLGNGNLVIASTGANFLNLPANVVTTSTTPAAIPAWSFPVEADKTYRIEIIGDYQTSATTTGATIGISLTNATGTVRGFATGTITASAAASELTIPIRATSGAGSSLTTTGVSAINTPHSIYMVLTFTCTGTGIFSIVWASEVSNSGAQLNQNSTLIYQSLN